MKTLEQQNRSCCIFPQTPTTATVLFRTAWFSQQKLQKLKLFCWFLLFFCFVFYSLLFVIFSDTSNIISDLRMLPQPVWFSQQRQLSTQCKQAKSVLLFYIFSSLALCFFVPILSGCPVQSTKATGLTQAN